MVRYVADIRRERVPLEQIPEMGYSSYDFIKVNDADVSRSYAMAMDADAGKYLAFKTVAMAGGGAALGVLGAGIGLTAANVFGDVYTWWHTKGQGNNEFWTEYFNNMKEVASPDGAFRDMVEGANAQLTYIGRAREGTPINTNTLGYQIGAFGGMFLRDTAIFLAAGGAANPAVLGNVFGGAQVGKTLAESIQFGNQMRGSLAMAGNMAVVEGLNKYHDGMAITDSTRDSLWPAIAAGVSTGATGAAFMYAIPKFVRDLAPQFSNASKNVNSLWEGIARTGKGAGISAAEFGGWSASKDVLEDIMNGRPIQTDGENIMMSVGIGLLLGGAIKGHGVFKNYGKSNATETLLLGYNPKPEPLQIGKTDIAQIGYIPKPPPEPLQIGYNMPWAETPQGLAAIKDVGPYNRMSIDSAQRRPGGPTVMFNGLPDGEAQVAFLADQIATEKRQLSSLANRMLTDAQARGEKIDVSAIDRPIEELVNKRLYRFNGVGADLQQTPFSKVPSDALMSGGGGRYYTQENLDAINRYLYKEFPSSQKIQTVEQYYGVMDDSLHAPEPVWTMAESGAVSFKARTREEYFKLFEDSLSPKERKEYERQLEYLNTDKGIQGYHARGIAKDAVETMRGDIIMQDLKNEATAWMSKEEVIAAKHDDMQKLYQMRGLDNREAGGTEFFTPEGVKEMLSEAEVKYGLDALLTEGGKIGDVEGRIKKFVADAGMMARRRVLEQGGTTHEAYVAKQMVEAEASTHALEYRLRNILRKADEDLRAGKIDIKKYGDYTAEVLTKHFAAREAENRGAGVKVSTIMSKDVGAMSKGSSPRKFLDDEAKEFGGIIPSGLADIYRELIVDTKSIMESHYNKNNFNMKVFRELMAKPENMSRINAAKMAYKNALNDIPIDPDTGLPQMVVSRKEMKEATSAAPQ